MLHEALCALSESVHYVLDMCFSSTIVAVIEMNQTPVPPCKGLGIVCPEFWSSPTVWDVDMFLALFLDPIYHQDN